MFITGSTSTTTATCSNNAKFGSSLGNASESYWTFTKRQWPDLAFRESFINDDFGIRNYNMSLTFKTLQPNGVIYLFLPVRNSRVGVRARDNFVGAFLRNGTVCHKFLHNSTENPAEACTTMVYNDGEWHNVMFAKNDEQAVICVEGDNCRNGTTTKDEYGSKVFVFQLYRIGGISSSEKPNATQSLVRFLLLE